MKRSPIDIIIYHNPDCGTSRDALAAIREAGVEPHIVQYLKTPPSRELLDELTHRGPMTPRDLVRDKEPIFKELGLDKADVTEDQLLDAMVAHPILINRPLVVSPRGVKLCRPAATVSELLP